MSIGMFSFSFIALNLLKLSRPLTDTVIMQSDIEAGIEPGPDKNSNDREQKIDAEPDTTFTDPNMVSWKPDDPENPLNWPRVWRGLHIFIISFMALTV